MRLAIFDFCDTLVNFQTANEFCRYVLKKESRYFYLTLDKFFEVCFVYRIAAKLSVKRLSQKRMLLNGLKGMNMNKLESYGLSFVDDEIQKKIYIEVFERFKSHIDKKDCVVINSGGYDAYLKHFSDKFNIGYSFSTRFKYVENIFTGQIEGQDCLGAEKVSRMKETEVLNKSYNAIFVYSDSITDMPIFNLATHKVAIIKQETIPVWCKEHFDIIKV
jgi:HAD superfamily hydrolase (TIGR01490 family)